MELPWLVMQPVIYFFYITGSRRRFRRAARFCSGFLNAIGMLAVFFVLGIILTAMDRALSPDDRRRSGLGRAAEV